MGMTSVGLKAVLVVTPRMRYSMERGRQPGERVRGSVGAKRDVRMRTLSSVTSQRRATVEFPVEEGEDHSLSKPNERARSQQRGPIPPPCFPE
jgi:hypothetical protein